MDYTKKTITFSEKLIAAATFLSNLPGALEGLYYAKYLKEDSICGLAKQFNRAVKNNPNGKALLFNDKSYTYTELDEWSNKIANSFLKKGLVKGDTISIFLENRPEFIATILGGSKIGIGMALVNTSQKGKVLIHSFNLLQPKMILFGQELIEPFDEVRSELSIEDKDIYFIPDDECQPNQKLDKYSNFNNLVKNESSVSLEHLIPTIKGNTPLYYIFTSGTTGLPKATIFNNRRSHRAYGLFGLIAMKLKKEDVMYVPLPMFHATGLAVAWGSVLAGYSTLALDRQFTASNFWKRIKHYKATSFAYVGELCNYILMQPECEEEKNNTVTKILGNGMRLANWDKMKNRYGIEVMSEFYASSEGNVGFSNVFNFDYTVGFGGVPYAIVKYDKDAEKPFLNEKGYMIKVKKGEVGLLIGEISKKSPFDGYTSKENSEKAILRNVFKNGDAYFNTGDLVRDQGFKHVQFVDRTGDTYRWKGENVSTSEIESILIEHEQIHEAVCYGVEIPGNNGRAGMAEIVTEKEIDENLDFKSVLNYLNQHCPKYAIPIFLRISKKHKTETTMTMKYAKSHLKDAAFYLDKVGQDLIYVLLPGAETYIPLTPELELKIKNQEIKF